MKMLDKRTRGDLIKLITFIVVTSLATGVLVVLIGNLSFEKTREYKAIFTDVTGLVKGDDIRIAGVKVGSVKKVEIFDRTNARVTFTVRENTAVTRSSTATIRYRNLVGQRYISVTQGVGDTTRLSDDATIGLKQTQPALDLTVLFNGFKPLFAALSPADVNKLSYEIIQVFQGEGGNIEGLLRSTGSVTQTLANRDQLIGDVINNLNSVLETVGGRDAELSNLIVQFRSFLGGLVKDKDAILNSLDSISALTQQTADITTGIRPGLVKSVEGLRTVATNLNKGRDEVDRALQILPIKLNKIGRTAIYGSFFNFYMCEFKAKVILPTGPLAIPYQVYPGGKGRCNLS
ncbi:MCE family protein [Nocardioides marmoriginsengisoli]|uniref:MCE family protein n=1 Tax=Nocardioides marmoriginsengisoli TaxID=661483 RepID=A0A3N0CCH4_9ACTN|nr:MCE family protein [Nocardioides marmoriginsengisoli]RNL61128.1 MCE family protein [Nocardioides marmoriginsengisoli]